MRASPAVAASDVASLRTAADEQALRLDQLAAAATTPEDVTAAQETAAALRASTLAVQADLMLRAPGQTPTAEQLGASDAAVRQAEVGSTASLDALERQSVPGDQAPPP